MTESFIDNSSKERFELHVGSDIVIANYKIEDDTIFIKYVEAPEALRGTGAAGQIMQGIVDFAKEKNLKLYPICGYAHSWLRRHPEYQSLLK